MSKSTDCQARLDEIDDKLNQMVAERDAILNEYAFAFAEERWGIKPGDTVKGIDGYNDLVEFAVDKPYWFYVDSRRMELWLLGKNMKRIRASDAVKVEPV